MIMTENISTAIAYRKAENYRTKNNCSHTFMISFKRFLRCFGTESICFDEVSEKKASKWVMK